MEPEIDDPSFYNPKLFLPSSDSDKTMAVEEILKPLVPSSENVKKFRAIFEEEMELGLAQSTTRQPALHMDNTYVFELPNGTEVGDFLGLDLGGTNFRVILLRLRPNKEPQFFLERYTIAQPLREGQGEKLFDFLAECIHDFMKDHHILDKKLPLGFTFSFAVFQQSLDVAIVDNWAGVFCCSGVLGKDAAQLLADAINRRGDIKVDVIAIMNDTTAAMVLGAFLDSKCAMSVVLGTGNNGCYLERLDRIPKIRNKDEFGAQEVIINPEWGLIFDDTSRLGFMLNEFDYEVDKGTMHAGYMIFEKVVGGQLLGEYIRLILLRLVETELLFSGRKSQQLLQKDSLTAKDVTAIEGDTTQESTSTRSILERIGYKDVSPDDVTIVKHVCAVYSVRIAKLLATCVAVILDRINKPMAGVALDGSVFKYHPKIRHLMTQYISEMTPGKQFKLIDAEDGSGKGAAIIAAVASRMYKTKKYPHVFRRDHF